MGWIHAATFAVGIVVGFLGGMFGKGGSAIATPLLSLIGLPGFIAVASPLPATVPGTLIASAEYWRLQLIDWRVVCWSIAVGVPSTILGSFFTKITGAAPLLLVTGLLVLGFGISFLFFPEEQESPSSLTQIETHRSYLRIKLFAVACFVGLVSGLLANSGGFLLAPCYVKFLKLPIKTSFACSLIVSAALAVPGTIVHAYLGHISWPITVTLALGSMPMSYLGARIAIHTRSRRLEKWYGAMLTLLGLFFLLHHVA